MSLRKKLSDHLVGGEVSLHIPPVDPASDLYSQAGTFANQMKALIDERNAYKERAETLLCQLDSVHHQLHHVASEREQYRRMAFRMINANGKLQATLEAIEGLFRNIRGTSQEVDHLASQVPKEPPKGNHEAPIDLDAPLADQHQNPTPEEIEEIRKHAGTTAPTVGSTQLSGAPIPVRRSFFPMRRVECRSKSKCKPIALVSGAAMGCAFSPRKRLKPTVLSCFATGLLFVSGALSKPTIPSSTDNP